MGPRGPAGPLIPCRNIQKYKRIKMWNYFSTITYSGAEICKYPFRCADVFYLSFHMK